MSDRTHMLVREVDAPWIDPGCGLSVDPDGIHVKRDDSPKPTWRALTAPRKLSGVVEVVVGSLGEPGDLTIEIGRAS